MRRNIVSPKIVVSTTTPHVTPANLSEYERAVSFIRLGTIHRCQDLPYDLDYDKWSYNDQMNYESGRQGATNMLQLAEPQYRAKLAQQVIAQWPEHVRRVPAEIERVLGFANTKLGRADCEAIMPADPDVQAAVTRDVRGRMTFKVPTVSEE